MAETNIGSATTSDMNSVVTDYSVPSATTDGPTDQKETEYINKDWPQQLGYYKKIPELKSAVDAIASWTVGKGFTADDETTLILMGIKGIGKDTFNTILENAQRVKKIGGDSFAEIITDDDGMLINLKPLSPANIKIVAGKSGRIIRYEQININFFRKILNKILSKKNKYLPEKIFHLIQNRIGDEIHGQSIIPQVEEIILMRNEAMADYRKLLHRNVVPRIVWNLDTDDDDEIAAFKAKADKAVEGAENLYIPKGAAEYEILAVAPNQTLNPLPWIEQLNDYFYEAVGVPKIIIGNSKNFTDAASKTSYLAWEQTVAEEQLELEEQILSQLNLVVKLEPVASLENDALSSRPKVEERGAEPTEPTAQPNDLTMETEGKK